MYFCAYVGEDEHRHSWLTVVNRHAACLSLTPYLQSRRMPDSRILEFGWLSTEPPDAHLTEETPEHITFTVLAGLAATRGPLAPPRDFSANRVRMEVSLADGTIRVAVPMVSLQQFFYATYEGAHGFSDDMRLLIRWAGLDLDERGAYALFDNAIIPPPLTISKRVLRIPGGHLFSIKPGERSPRLEATFIASLRPLNAAPLASPEESLRQVLDPILAALPEHPAVLFSGGVDSGLLAARLAALGRNDVTLVNFVTGPRDGDAGFAAQMADHLGLRLRQIKWTEDDLAVALEALGQHYTFPFGDTATPAALALVRAISVADDRLSAVITGEGGYADFGIFGHTAYFDRIYAIPRVLRCLLATAYVPLGVWRRHSHASRFLGAASRSLRMSEAHAVALQRDVMDGIAYRTPKATAREVDDLVQGHFETLLSGLDLYAQSAFWTWLRLETGTSGAKWFEALRRYGVPMVCPLLEPDVLNLACTMPHEQTVLDGFRKAPMRALLLRSVPRELVYRPKGGFRLPFTEMFAHPAMRAFMNDVVLVRGNPLFGLCLPSAVREMDARAASGQTLSAGGRQFLWTLAFASGWLSQLGL